MYNRKEIYEFVDTFSRLDYKSATFTHKEYISIINNFILAIKYLDMEKNTLVETIQEKNLEITEMAEKMKQMIMETEKLHVDYKKIYNKKLTFKQRITGKI